MIVNVLLLCCIDNTGLDGVNNELGLSMFYYYVALITQD